MRRPLAVHDRPLLIRTAIEAADVEALRAHLAAAPELKDADVTEVLRSIARLADLNIVIQPGVSGPVTVELDRVP